MKVVASDSARETPSSGAAQLRAATGLHAFHPLSPTIAGYGLEGFVTEPSVSPPGRDWRMLAAELVDQRLTGLAMAAVQGGWLSLEDEQMSDLLQRQRDAMIWALSIERTLMSIDEAFGDAGIEYIVLKGTSLAQTLYPDPSHRPFADLDLLIRGPRWERACALLPSLGFTRQHPESRPGFVDAFGKAAVHINDAGQEIDLHRRLVVGPHGLSVDPDELFEHRAWFQLGGRWFRRLEDTLLFLHMCMHASLGHMTPRLMPLRDVLQVAERGEIDWEHAEEQAHRWKLRAVVDHAVGAAPEVLGVRAPEEATRLAASLVPTPQETRWLRAYTTDRRNRGGTTVSTLGAIHGVRAKASYSAALLFPKRDFLEARTRSDGVGSYLTRWRVILRWLSARIRRVAGGPRSATNASAGGARKHTTDGP